MKKICFVTPIYSPAKLSGSEVYVKNLAEEFVKSGAEVTVITSNALDSVYWYNPFSHKVPLDQEVINGVNIVRLKVSHIRSSILFIINRYLSKFLPIDFQNYLSIISFGPILKNLLVKIADINPTIIHCSPFPMSVCLQLARLKSKLNPNTKIIYTPFFHPEISKYNNSMLQSILDTASLIHSVTETEKKYIIDKYSVDPNVISTIPLYIDEKSKIIGSEVSSQLKKRFNNKNKYVLFVGNKGTYKGALTTLASVGKIYRKHKNIRLVAMGGPTPEWTKSTAKSPKFLIDLPYLQGSEKEYVFSQSNIFCMPSVSDSFGLVYLEAWKYSKPVIAVNSKTMREVLKNGACYVEPHDISGLAETITELIYTNSRKGLSVGKIGFGNLNRLYAKEKIVELYKSIFLSFK